MFKFVSLYLLFRNPSCVLKEFAPICRKNQNPTKQVEQDTGLIRNWHISSGSKMIYEKKRHRDQEYELCAVPPVKKFVVVFGQLFVTGSRN